jgi:hypothetical protein
MSWRGALRIALLAALVTQALGICQFRCELATPADAVASTFASHACHASTSSDSGSTVKGIDEGCRHLWAIAAIIASAAQASVVTPASSAAIVIHDSWPVATELKYKKPPRFGPPLSFAGTLRI